MAQRLPSISGESLSHQSLVQVEDLLPRTNHHSPRLSLPIKFQSKSLDDLQLRRRYRRKHSDDDDDDDTQVSNTTHTEMDLTGIGCDEKIDIENNRLSHHDDEDHFQPQRSHSAPVSPTQIYDKELAAFIQCEQQQQQQQKIMADSFVYNIDLSDTNETTHQSQSRTAIFLDDDYSLDDIPYEPSVNSSSIIHSCLTITEENEEELEQLRRADNEDDDEEEQQEKTRNHLLKINDGSIPTITLYDDDDRADILENDDQIIDSESSPIIIMNTTNNFDSNQDIDKRLSTIYESPSPQPRIEEEEEEVEEEEEEEIYDEAYDKLIVYDIANVEKTLLISPKSELIKSPSSTYRSPILDRTRIRSCYTDASFKPCPILTNTISASRLCGTSSMITSKVFTPPSSTLNDRSSLSPVINTQYNYINKSLASLPTDQQSPTRLTPMSLSVPILLLPVTHEQSPYMLDENNKLIPSQHIKTMKVIQSTSSSLSDFIMPTPTSTFNNTIHYEEVSSVHHSLTDCSSIPHMSCCVPILDEDSSVNHKSSEDNQRRPSFTRRILTNGLLLSHCSSHHSAQRRAQPPLTFNQHRHQTKPKSEEKLSTLSSPIGSSSSSSESNSPTGEKFMSRSDYILQQQQQQQQQQNISQQRKASSLKTISVTANQQPSKILYPIDFESNTNEESWYQKQSLTSHQNKVPTSDSGIVIDTTGTRPTSNSSIEQNDADGIPSNITNSGQLKQYESTYRQTLADLTIIKKNIVDIESRLSEAMRELEIERALVEGEHELVFKQILDNSEIDQEKIRHLYNDLQLLTERIMTEKTRIRNEIDYTQQILYKLDYELHELEEQYRPTDDKILKKKEILAETRRKHEDLEFQLMEFETRCEAELEQAEEHFQNEQIIVAQNSKIRQNTLRDLDHQQNIILHQVIVEKDKLEREKQKLKLLFKQKKFEANELEQKIHGRTFNQEKTIYENGHHLQAINGKDAWFTGNTAMYHSTPSNLYNTLSYTDNSSSSKSNVKDNHQDKLDEIKEMIAVAKLEKMTILEQQLRERYDELVHCHDEHIKRVELEHKLADEIQNRDYLIECQVKLREKNRIQERPLTRYLPIRSLDFDLRAHIEGAGHSLDSSHIHITSTSCRGFLLKMGGMKFKTWNRRWFVFDRKRRSLFYYQDKTETKLRGCIYFQSIVEVYVDHLQSISLRSPEPREATFIVKTIERPYYLVAPTVESMRIWVDVIITGAEGNTFAGDS